MSNKRFEEIMQINIIFIIISLLFFSQSLYSDESVESVYNRPRVALVLSGGGARGLAQIGVIKALYENGIIPDIIIATSMGAIIGSLYCAGYSPDSIGNIAREIEWNEILKNTPTRKKKFVNQKIDPENFLFELRFDYDFTPILPSSISFGQAFYDILTPLLAAVQFNASMNFDKFKIPLRIVATDLISGKKVVFSNGNVVTAIRASCSIPLAYSPINYNGMYLVDGGISSNIPIETAVAEGANFIIASDVTSPLWKKKDLENPVKLFDQIIAIGIKRQKEIDKLKSNVLITPDLANFSNTDFSFIDTLISIGYYETLKSIDIIKSNIPFQCISSKVSTKAPDSITHYLQNYPFAKFNSIKDSSNTIQSISNPGVIKSLAIIGNDRTSTRVIKTVAGLSAGDTLGRQSFQKGINSIYSTGLFQNVNMEYDTNRILKIFVEEKKYWRMRMGLRFDEFHLGEGFIQPAYENLFGLGICTFAHIQYGLRREKYVLDLQGNYLFSSNIANMLQIQIYTSNERIFQRQILISTTDTIPDYIKLNEHSLRKTGYSALIGTSVGKFLQLSSGFRMERYKIQQTDQSPFGDALGLKLNKRLPCLMLKLNIDTMDKFPFPNTGWKQKFFLITDFNNRGINATFVKIQSNIGKYSTLRKQHAFFPQLQFSWTNGNLPEIERVFVGGLFPEERYQDMSVYNYIPFIGLKPRAFSGDCMILIHFDYQLTLKKNFYAHMITDWGLIWNVNEIKYSDIISDLMEKAPIGMGIGLSYESVLGPIRFFYGQLFRDIKNYDIKSEGQLYFSAGYDF